MQETVIEYSCWVLTHAFQTTLTESACMFDTQWLTSTNHIQVWLKFTLYNVMIHALRLEEWLDLQGTIRNNPQTKPKYTKCSLIFEPIVNEAKKLRCSVHITGAIYQAPVHNVCGGCLAAEFPFVNGGGLEGTVATLPNGCCQSCPNCNVSLILIIL